VTPARLHDYLKMVAMVSAGLMAFELEPETGITWLRQLPPKPPPRGVPLIQDDGSPTFRDWDNSSVIGGEGDGQ
jgi:hypothetical protein